HRCLTPWSCLASAPSMTPPPPTPPLSPYTTLFRSFMPRELNERPGPDDDASLRHGYLMPDPLGEFDADALEENYPEDWLEYRNGDRKSTRLNSSHVKTSYAVFCLKKKMSLTEPCKY